MRLNKTRRFKKQRGGTKTGAASRMIVANGFEGGYATHGGSYVTLGKRNEDKHVVLPVGEDGLLVAIFDGHGGSDYCSQFVSTTLPPLIIERIEAVPTGLSDTAFLAEVLRTSFLEVNARFLAEFEDIAHLTTFEDLAGQPFSIRQKYALGMTGSTATVVIITPTDMVVAHAGDSPAIVMVPSGLVVAHTEDHDCHNPAEIERLRTIRYDPPCKEKSGVLRLLDENGLPGLMPTRGFGDRLYVKTGYTAEPEINIWPRMPGILLAVMSDSFVERILYNDDGIAIEIKPLNKPADIGMELSAHVRDTGSLSQAALHAVQARVDGMYDKESYVGDNTTLILVDVGVETAPFSVARFNNASAPASASATNAAKGGRRIRRKTQRRRHPTKRV